jgi:hypothetical protein
MKTIRIGCLEYTIKEVDKLVDDDDRPIYGQVAYGDCEILIWKELDPQVRRATLWHEIIHAILVNAGYVGEHDEQMVSAISHGIYDVLLDNPEIADMASSFYCTKTTV